MKTIIGFLIFLISTSLVFAYNTGDHSSSTKTYPRPAYNYCTEDTYALNDVTDDIVSNEAAPPPKPGAFYTTSSYLLITFPDLVYRIDKATATRDFNLTDTEAQHWLQAVIAALASFSENTNAHIYSVRTNTSLFLGIAVYKDTQAECHLLRVGNR